MGDLIKYNNIGDTLFFKTYTDTSLYFDNIFTCCTIANNGVLLGGGEPLMDI